MNVPVTRYCKKELSSLKACGVREAPRSSRRNQLKIYRSLRSNQPKLFSSSIFSPQKGMSFRRSAIEGGLGRPAKGNFAASQGISSGLIFRGHSSFVQANPHTSHVSSMRSKFHSHFGHSNSPIHAQTLF
eukprot:gb/GEZN01030453.1/.p1 GENE.gb/GEZN01030453.1/~~gb/GEZN01030453.1/.p1  ORF type:complete len:130 (-),score=0.23 gb/GEZN01030453.1/:19-408(-)